MIDQQILGIRSRLLKLGWTQVDLVTYMFKSGRYKSRNSLQIQVSYLLTGRRFNKTSKMLMEHIIEVLEGIESGEIIRESVF